LKHKKKGSSKAGRKPTPGDRYPCGKKRPPPPNAKVMAIRRAMLGRQDLGALGLVAAENPLDLMLARGWLEEGLHRAARTYAGLHRRAGLEGPALRTGQYERAAKSFDAGMGDAEAMGVLRALWETLTAAQAQVLLDVTVREAWPEWVVFRLAGREVPPVWEVKRERLLAGLERVRAGLRRAG
jgi:hypothetical protein